MLTNENVVKLGDFGVAKTVSNIPKGMIRRANTNEGSPAYMSPEQRSGRLNKENFDYLTRHQENVDIWFEYFILNYILNLFN